MNCHEFERYCLDYCDNNLSSEIRGQFEEHLLQCEPCQNLIALCNMENEVLRDPVDLPALAPDFNSRLLARVRSECDIYPHYDDMNGSSVLKKFILKRPYFNRPATLLAAVLLLVLILPSLLNQDFTNTKQLPENAIQDSQPQYDNTKLQKTAANGSEQSSPDEEQVADLLKSKSTSIGSAKSFKESGQEFQASNQPIPLAAPTPQDIVSGNGSSREINNAKIGARLPAEKRGIYQPYPENIPPAYILLQSSESNGQFIYIYRETAGSNELNITITPINQQPAVTVGLAGDAAEQAPKIDNESCKVLDNNAAGITSATAVLNSASRDILRDDFNYRLTLSGKLPQAEIEAIASAVTLGEK